MVFYVVILKTDTPNKPHAINVTTQKVKHRQKQVFTAFIKQFAANRNEYYVESLEKKGNPRKFYVKAKAFKMRNQLAVEHGYYVRFKNTWGKYVEPAKPSRKKPPKKQYMVRPIPTEELRECVLEAIEYTSCNGQAFKDSATKLMKQRGVPVFSMETRMWGMKTLFQNANDMKNQIEDEIMNTLAEKERAHRKRMLKPGEKFIPNGDPRKWLPHGGGDWYHDRRMQVSLWNSRWYEITRNVNDVCGQLTNMYGHRCGSRGHLQDAIPFKANEQQYQIKVI